MKPKPIHRKTAGFTLVELLVVIVIVAALAAISFSLSTRMMKRADVAKSLQNIQQIGSMLAVYSSDNSSNLPAIKAITVDAEGNREETDWYIALLKMTYPDVERPLLSSTGWWESTKPILRNPLLENSRFKPWFPGYAMNISLSRNLFPGSSGEFGSGDGPDSRGIPLSRIPDPARTPVVSTTRNWFYNAANLTALTTPSSLDKSLLVDDKVPVLFVDGHVESMTPQEYVTRRLGTMPN